MAMLLRLVAWATLSALLLATGVSGAHAQRAQPAPGSAEVPAAALPPEARETLALIARGGPFPYQKDGTVFRNREGRLPAKPAGYYREYTVRTPGAKNRGARRIVAGTDGDKWYTDDHYDSFRRIRE